MKKVNKPSVKKYAIGGMADKLMKSTKSSGQKDVDKALMKAADWDMKARRAQRELTRLGKSKDASVGPAYSSNEKMLKQAQEQRAKNLAEAKKLKIYKQNKDEAEVNASPDKTKTPVKKKTDIKQKEAMGNAVGTLKARSAGSLSTGVKTGEIQNLNLPAKSTPTKSSVRDLKKDIKDARKANRPTLKSKIQDFKEKQKDKKVEKLTKKLDRIKGTKMMKGGTKKPAVKMYKKGGKK